MQTGRYVFILLCIIVHSESLVQSQKHERAGVVCGISVTCPSSPPVCHGQQGKVSVLVSGGTSDYEYAVDQTKSWNPSPYFNEPEGSHTCFVRDKEDNTCTASIAIVVPPGPPALTGAVQSQTSLRCHNSGNTGAFTLKASGGIPGYTYSIDGTTWGGNTFSDLAPEPYNPQVKDSKGCIANIPTIVIAQPSDIVGSISGYTNLQCVDSGDTGTITFSAYGGTGALSYSIDQVHFGSNYFTNLAPGTYDSFLVKDASSCEYQIAGSVTITRPSAVSASITSQSAPACPGGQGSITIGASGGNAPYNYSIDGTNFGSGNTFSVGVGGFTYYVRDKNKCQRSFTGTMQDASNPVTGSIAIKSGFKCSTDGDIASVTLTASHGAPPYTYSLDNQNFGPNSTFINLGVGPVKGYIKDKNNCATSTQSITLSKPSTIIVTYDSVSAQCFGTFDAQISGGTGPYTYTLNGSVPTGSRPDGHYAWKVLDSNGCSQTGFVDLKNSANTGITTINTTSKVPTKGGNLTLIGYFPQPLNTSLDSVLVHCVSPTNSTLICPVSSGTGGNHTVNVTSGLGGCQKSINTVWSYMNPQVASITEIGINGGIITIQGTNFGNGTFSPTVTLGRGVACSGCVIKGTEAIVCTCPYTGYMNENLVVTIHGLSSAPFGFSYTELDVCANNGGCDYHVNCFDLGNGQKVCSACPKGTIGTGNSQCNTTCGDGKCEAVNGEDCLLCPQDCDQEDCGLCGDRVCDSPRENCSSCFKDCGPCDINKSCDGGCGYGQCISGSGLCDCIQPWTGPTCSSQGQAINVTTNSSNPIVTVEPIRGDSKNKAQFSISIKSISEFTIAHTLVYSLSLSEIEFSLAKEQNGQNTKFNYSASLKNGAFISVILWQLGQETSLEFANMNMTYPTDTIKLYVDISAWPFRALANLLEIVLDSSSSSRQSTKNCVNSQEDERSSLQWLLVVVDGVSLYGQFESQAVIDGRVQTISYALNQSDHSVSAILPHFWDSANLDPRFNVLLSDSKAKCGARSKTNTKLILEIVLPVVAFVIIVLVISLAFGPWIKLRFQLWKRERVPTSEKGVKIGKINNNMQL